MNVKELIKKLRQYNPNADIEIDVTDVVVEFNHSMTGTIYAYREDNNNLVIYIK